MQAMLKLALMFKDSSKLKLTHVGLGGNNLGGVAGQCLLRNLHAYATAAATAAATAPTAGAGMGAGAGAAVFVDTQQCSTGSLEP